jgi:hypothetical protein
MAWNMARVNIIPLAIVPSLMLLLLRREKKN